MGILYSDLRIGNKVQDNNGFIFDVVSIHNDGTIYCDFEGNEGSIWEFDNNNPCQGIELTEDILLKCGFDIVGYGRYHSLEFKGFRKGLYDVFLLENGSIMFMDNVFEKLITSFKYLHQLQNLYFTLTNEELNIEL